MLVLIFTAYIAGQLVPSEEVYGTTYSDAPTATGDVYETAANDEVITIQKTGIYKIVASGSKAASNDTLYALGGAMECEAKLTKGTTLNTRILPGQDGYMGSKNSKYYYGGGTAMCVCIGGVSFGNILLVGSGASGGSKSVLNGTVNEGAVYGGQGYYVKTSDGLAHVGQACWEVMTSMDPLLNYKQGGAGYGYGGQSCKYSNSYVDARKVISYKNVENVSETAYLSIEYLGEAPADNETEALNNLNSTVKAGFLQLTSVLENLDSQNDILTVISGHSFNELIKVSKDTTVGGTSEGITVINNNNLDKVVRISGKINTEGTYQVCIDNIIYTIKAISEPDSSNVNIILN